jgi:FAD:protein FMN transferase
METVKVARNAMATRFEIVVQGSKPAFLRAVAEEAQINARAAYEPVRVSPGVFRLLEKARELSLLTGRRFDISVGPLLKAWGFTWGNGEMPSEEAIAEALELVGMHRVQLDSEEFTVTFEKPGMLLDCGSIGKGWALEAAMEIVKEAEIENALLHGGTSTICALGLENGERPWRIAITGKPGAEPQAPLSVVDLSNEGMSVSAVWGKSFNAGERTYGHVIDPRTGHSVSGAELAMVVLPSATETDALSTALLVGGESMEKDLRELRPQIKTFVLKSK